MENKAISKMNKKELYQKCQEQQEEIQKMKLFQDNSEDVLNDFDDDNDNLIDEVKKLKISIKEYKNEYHNLEQSSLDEKNKLRKENEILRNANTTYVDLLAGEDGTIDKIDTLLQENEKLKEELEESKNLENQLEKKIKRYIKKTQKLKYEVEAIDKQATHYCLENNTLKEELEELQQRYNKLEELF